MRKAGTLAVLLVWACAAQVTLNVRGEITGGSGVDLTHLEVRLESASAHEVVEKAYVNVTGDFEIRGVAAGIYTLRVMDEAENEITSQPVEVTQANSQIAVRIQNAPKGPTGESISVARLRHKPDKRAMSAAVKAQKLSQAGAHARAAEELEKAVTFDPQFTEARVNLGAEYMRAGRYEEAVAAFREAVKADAATAMYQSNLAVGLAKLGQLGEAETWARSSLRLNGASPVGHYVLGCVLAARGGQVAEAIEHLRIAARTVPRAHETLAALYRKSGKEELAREEMREWEAVQDLKAGWATELR